MRHPYETVKKFIYDNPTVDFLDECNLFFFKIRTYDSCVEEITFKYDWEKFYDLTLIERYEIVKKKAGIKTQLITISDNKNTMVSEKIIFPFSLQIISTQEKFFTVGEIFSIKIDNALYSRDEQTAYFDYLYELNKGADFDKWN